MIVRALAVWCLLLILAIMNGGLRELVLGPRIGPVAGHMVSTVVLSTVILGTTWLTAPWLGIPDARTAASVGAGWLLLTLAFEFLGGHFVFHRPWSALLADYDLSRGRIWILVLITTALAPWLCRQAP